VAVPSAHAWSLLDGVCHAGPKPYSPTVANYVVVDPAPYAAAYAPPASARTCATPANAAACGVTGSAHQLPAPVYPWGWFGARSGKGDVRKHIGYYGDYLDISLGRWR
jgi:hypothetical protein